MTTKQTEVAIVGGGLSGLACALRLHQAGATCVVLEAADRVGGRIGVTVDDSGQTIGDLGPTWVWPPAQQTVSRWLDELDVQPLPQFEEGDAVVERSREEQPRRMPLPGQWGMTRLVGGPWSLVAEIEKRLPPECIKTSTPVSQIQRNGNALDVTSVDGTTRTASQVVIAAPLRIAAQQIDFNGLLDEPTLGLMGAAPTWMAAQAKVVIGYDRAFWREAGLSGRIASQVGPMVEVHDHCGPDAMPAALFGFIGVPPQVRLEHQQELRAAIIEQLVRCFGELAAEPTHLHIEDWAQNDFICVEEDRRGPGSHPSILHESLRAGFTENAIRFAGAETSSQSPGLIDGALEAAERAAQQILERLR